MKKILFLLVVCAVKICDAQTVATISLAFPAMPVNRIAIGMMQAQEEPFAGTLTLQDGTTLNVTQGSIPATYVRGHLVHYTVDACVGTAAIGGGKLVINLPEEPVRLRKGVMTALAITAPATVTLADGRVGVGSVFFPDAPTRFLSPGKYLAAAVVATGTFTFP